MSQLEIHIIIVALQLWHPPLPPGSPYQLSKSNLQPWQPPTLATSMCQGSNTTRRRFLPWDVAPSCVVRSWEKIQRALEISQLWASQHLKWFKWQYVPGKQKNASRSQSPFQKTNSKFQVSSPKPIVPLQPINSCMPRRAPGKNKNKQSWRDTALLEPDEWSPFKCYLFLLEIIRNHGICWGSIPSYVPCHVSLVDSTRADGATQQTLFLDIP